MPLRSPLSAHTLRKRSAYAALFCSAVLLGSAFWFAWHESPPQVLAVLAAIYGAGLGLLYSTLDHEVFTIKAASMAAPDLLHRAYCALRVAIPAAIGYAASYVLFVEAGMDLLKQSAVAFAAAYVADATKLILSK